jgi:hypothetical protein
LHRTPQPFATVTEGIRKRTTHLPRIGKLYTRKLDDLESTFDRTFVLGLREDATADEVAQEERNQDGRSNATWLRPGSNQSSGSAPSRSQIDVRRLPYETAFTEVG